MRLAVEPPKFKHLPTPLLSECMIYLFCCSLSAGTYNSQEAILYSMSVADTYISGGMFDKEKERNTADDSKCDS